MAMSWREEKRALSKDELDLVEKSRHPHLRDLSDRDLSDLVKLVRERRDRAQTEANRQRREMRSKGSPKGQAPAKDSSGTQAKREALAMAVRRLNSEAARRTRFAARNDLVANARKALALKRAGSERDAMDHNSRTAHEGMRNIPSRKRESLVRPMELGRQRQAAKTAQARRDAKG